MEIQKSIRYRVKVEISGKGVKIWDCTTDMTGYSIEEVLEKSDELVERLERRYPITEVKSG